ncbi:zinc finger CCCH-type antiviral protein 1 isoform X1 [Notamacropus eugenii]|uniref:zinc finger CCCH-type antiviral protein 1 isoform X1 n=1 Tax=Notamacropus eugenii TaxID=9315 RepID=UPI003B685CD0
MADPAVCGFLTQVLCTHGGRMELRKLLGFIELPEAQLLEVLREAGPDRFVLLDEDSDAGPTVLATTRVRVCRRIVCGGACEALHLCKLNLMGRCRRERNYCKYSHEIHSEKNVKILKKHDLSVLTQSDLAVLLLQSDPFFLPDICKYYKGENRPHSCSRKTECMKLHICEHYLEGRCGFVHCNRSHNLMDTKVLGLLKEEGLTDSVVRNIQDICNEKHARSNKRISRRRGPPEPKTMGSRNQSRNRYFFERELPPSPSASVGTTRIPEPDKTDPVPLPSSEGKVNESGATKNSIALSPDCVPLVSASPKVACTQEVSQVGTNSSFSGTGHIENNHGSQGGIQHGVSLSPPASSDKGTTPAVSNHTSSRVNVSFGSETDLYSDPGPVTTSKSGLVPSYSYTHAGDDCGSQKVYSSPAPNTTFDLWGNNAVVFSKYKPTTNLKKEESSFKSTHNQSTLVNPQMTKTATLIGKLETPVANNTVANDSCSVKSGTLSNKQLQLRESVAREADALTLNSARIIRNERKEPFCVPQSIQASPISNTAAAHVRPKVSSASNVSGIQKGILAQTSSPIDFKARVSNTAPSEMDNNDAKQICLDYLRENCKLQSSCKSVHFHLPYRWQVYISDNWKDLKEMEEIEKAYCDPSISRSHSVDFQKMLLSSYPVRRLSTPSTVQKPNDALATKWLWYWKKDLYQWIEYGEENSEFVSGDLEFFFLLCPEEFVEFTEGERKYKVDFKEMIQTNVVSLTERKVRRRPKFVSSVTVYWTKKQEVDQNKEVSFNFPSHWDKMNMQPIGSTLFEVTSTSVEYSSIKSCFNDTMKNFDIQKIMRNQNASLWNDFQRMKSTMLNGGNEKTLFHAADPSNMRVICDYNFDWSFQSLHEVKYGKGIYFAKDARSSHINHKSSAKNRIMFVAQVLVGTSVQGKMEYTYPSQNVTRCDSWVDNVTNPSTFVIFDKHQIYPAYIIEYTDIDKSCTIS